MKNKKNIDRLFQERFKDFETEPNAQTWANIQAGLSEKKKERKIIPLWLKYTGIAAAFVLGFFAINTTFKSNTKIQRKKIGIYIFLATLAIQNYGRHAKHRETQKRFIVKQK